MMDIFSHMPAARRIPPEKPPSDAAERRILHQQAIMRRRVGERIKKHRTAAGLSLRALETKTSITSSYLSELERGIRSPTSDLLVRLCHAFPGVTPASFLEDD